MIGTLKTWRGSYGFLTIADRPDCFGIWAFIPTNFFLTGMITRRRIARTRSVASSRHNNTPSAAPTPNEMTASIIYAMSPIVLEALKLGGQRNYEDFHLEAPEDAGAIRDHPPPA